MKDRPTRSSTWVSTSLSREQVATDRPPGIAAIFNALLVRHGNAHSAEHAVSECLAESLWEAQRANAMPDEAAYLERLRRL